jgi:phosphatidylglycerophosphate synthase
MTTAIVLPPTEASFFNIAGLPLIQRAALSALRGGCGSVLVIGGDHVQRLRDIFERDTGTRNLRVVGQEELSKAASDCICLPSDWLLTPEAVKRVCERGTEDKPASFHFPWEVNNGWENLLGQVDGELCRRIVTREDARVAEEVLIQSLRAATTDTDGPIARFDRALSTRISRFLVRTALRPNHITTIGALLGLLGAWCFIQGTYGANIVGAFLCWCTVIIDGCDGEVARLKFQETRYGGLYDIVTDNIVHAAVFVGLSIGHFRVVPGASVPLFAALLLGGFLCALAATYFCLLRHPPVNRIQPKTRKGRVRQRLLRGFELVMNRDFAYLVLLLAIVDRLGWFLWGCVVGTYLYAAGLVWIYRWREGD